VTHPARTSSNEPGPPGATRPLIVLGDPGEPIARTVLDAPGGFAWWYLDALDAQGDGLVLIWSFGLPFLPGYLDGARRGRGQRAAARPSLNLALYRRGRPTFYLLQEYAEAEATWTVEPGPDGSRRERWTLGATTIEGVRSAERVQLSIDLDCPLPRTAARLVGTIDLEGPAARASRLAPADTLDHHWSPQAGPSRCRAALHTGAGAPFTFEGDAYHDRNASLRPFSQLGIERWVWGRRVDEAATTAWYVLWPEGEAQAPVAWVVRLARDGALTVEEDVPLELGPRRRAAFGMHLHPELRLAPRDQAPLEVSVEQIVDDGPFYLRVLDRTRQGDQERLGWGEWVRPDRVDLARHRSLVRMRVHRTFGGNSFWLPLFAGPSEGRLRRLLGLERGGAR
jgi:carotenoid 1,2-hydratase